MVESRDERIVEMYVGWVESTDGGTWEIYQVRVDSALAEEEAAKSALDITTELLYKGEKEAAFVGVYHIWSDDAMEAFHWQWLDEEE